MSCSNHIVLKSFFYIVELDTSWLAKIILNAWHPSTEDPKVFKWARVPKHSSLHFVKYTILKCLSPKDPRELEPKFVRMHPSIKEKESRPFEKGCMFSHHSSLPIYSKDAPAKKVDYSLLSHPFSIFSFRNWLNHQRSLIRVTPGELSNVYYLS